MSAFTFRSLALAALASGLLLTTSCKRDADATPDEDITTAEDRSEANIETALTTEAYKSAAPTNPEVANSGYVTTDAEFKAKFGPCVTRTYDYLKRTLTIDFHNGCVCADGRTRSGMILVRFTTDVLTRRAGAVVRRYNYFVNGNQHIATRTFTDLGNGSFAVAVDSASIIRANNGGTHSWTANWNFARTDGYGTPSTLDDVYSVTGGAAGTNRKGMGYTTTIQTPLIRRGDCYKYYVAGTFSITNSNNKTLLFNYDPSGNQGCDNTASVTVNGRTKMITLR